jgi:signal peptide peptidase SppA
MITLPRVAGRIFGNPLAIDRAKLDVIVTAIGPRLQGLPMDDPAEVTSRAPVDLDAAGIATIDVCGSLVAKCSGMDAMSGLTSYADIAAEFSAALTNPACRGIILAIDSPGGEVAGMFELADLIVDARGQKPICAVVECAASAAFLIASAADQIVVSRTGITGSVGIICLHLDQSAADEKAGLKYTAIYAGDRKTDGNPHEPLSPEARGGMQDRVDKVYGMFVTAAAGNRGIAEAAVRKTQAAVYMGADGVAVGFADYVGTVDDAARAIKTSIQTGARLSATSFSSSAASAARKEPFMAETQAAESKVPTPAEIETMVSEARAAGFADASQIVTLCALAGTPARAAEFITARKSVADVSAALLAAKVEADEKLKLNPGLLPGAAEQKEGAQGKADPWGKVLKAIGVRTKEQN